MKDINININIQNAQRIPNKMTSKRYTPRHVIELLKDRIQRVAREQKNHYIQEILNKMIRFLIRKFGGQKQWGQCIQSALKKPCQPRILYPTKLSFKSEGEIKTFIDIQKLRECITTSSGKEVLKGVLQGHIKIQRQQQKPTWGNKDLKKGKYTSNCKCQYYFNNGLQLYFLFPI